MKQLEHYEDETNSLRQQLHDLQTQNSDLKIKTDMASKDKDNLRKKLTTTQKESGEMTYKERELMEKMDVLQQQIKEKDFTIERKVEESFNLKKIID